MPRTLEKGRECNERDRKEVKGVVGELEGEGKGGIDFGAREKKILDLPVVSNRFRGE